jgi:hypothetical protein
MRLFLVVVAFTTPTLVPAQPGAWTRIASDPIAPGWTQGLMTFDRARSLCVLVNGSDVYEGAGTTWRLAASPPNTGGTGAGFAFDDVRQRPLWFGGGILFSNTTTDWTGTAWNTVTTANAPSPRRDTAMAYDRARGEVVLRGEVNQRLQGWL